MSLQLINASASPEVQINENFDALGAAALFGRRAPGVVGLTWGYCGGIDYVDGVRTVIADGTVALTASNTNYVEASRAGVVSANVTAFTPGSRPVRTIVTGVSAIISEVDERNWAGSFATARLTKSIAGGAGDTVLTAQEARVDQLKLTGALTGNRNVVVPAVPWSMIVDNETTGAFTATVKTPSGAGVVVPQGTTVLVYCDGTDVKLFSAAASGGTAGRHSIPVSAAAMIPSATGGCAALATVASAADQPDITSLDFDATTQEFAQFSIPMPKSWNEGTVTFRPIWSHAATTTNFGVVWELQALAVGNGEAIAQAFGTPQTSTDTGGTTDYKYDGPESSAITVAGTPAAEDTVYFRISRVPSDGADTMAIDARLHGIVLYITTDAENDA